MLSIKIQDLKVPFKKSLMIIAQIDHIKRILLFIINLFHGENGKTFLRSENEMLSICDAPLASTSLAIPSPFVSFIISSFKSVLV